MTCFGLPFNSKQLLGNILIVTRYSCIECPGQPPLCLVTWQRTAASSALPPRHVAWVLPSCLVP